VCGQGLARRLQGVDPPEREDEHERGHADRRQPDADGTLGDRALGAGGRGEHAVAEQDDRERPVALGDGLRVLGFAERLAEPGATDRPRDAAERDLTWLGLAALKDPPRAGVADAVRRCREAGLRIIVITGDQGATASAIARQVGIVSGRPTVVNGPEIDPTPRAPARRAAARHARARRRTQQSRDQAAHRRLAASRRPRRRHDRRWRQ
jgi:hypothetical protein